MTGKVAVTGATGFVGKRLVAGLLTAGYGVRALVRAQASSLPAEVEQVVVGPIEHTTAEAWRAALSGCDYVAHLAGIAHIGPGVPEAAYDAVNHRATLALGQAAADSGVKKFVFLSSIRAQTGPSAAHVLTEQSPAEPTDAYGRSKLAAERGLAALQLAHVCMRPTLILGDEPKGNLALLAKLARSGLPLPFAALRARRSLVAIDDVVAAMIHALTLDGIPAQTYVLAHPDALTVGDMITALREGLGISPRLFALPEGVLAAGPALIGRRDIWDRLAAPLVASSEKLLATGYRFRRAPAEVLRALGQGLGQALRQ